MATIIVSGDNMLIRGFLRSRRIPLSTIRLVETIEQPNMYGMLGRTLAIRTTDGHTIVAGEFWSRINRAGHAPRLDDLPPQLNAVLGVAKPT